MRWVLIWRRSWRRKTAMTDLVLIKPIGSKLEPYTTTDKIAEFAQVQHKAVNQLIRRHMKDLELFGKVEFEWHLCREARPGKALKSTT